MLATHDTKHKLILYRALHYTYSLCCQLIYRPIATAEVLLLAPPVSMNQPKNLILLTTHAL